MKNTVLVALGGKLVQAGIAAEGLHFLEVTLGVTHNNEAAMREALDLTQKLSDEFQAATVATQDATVAVHEADEKATTLITVSRELLKPKLGSRYSLAWNAVGFYNRTLQVPTRQDRRLSLVASIRGYLEAHPEAEVPGVMTAVLASAAAKELSDAIAALNVAQSTQRQTKAERDNAAKALGTRLRNLFHELKQFLPANDPRWLEFGFNVPADMTVPEAPTVFTVAPGAVGHVYASWEMPKGATRTRLFQQIVGVDAKFVRVDTFKETSTYLGGYTSGAHVKFYITAANGAGESLPSETVEVVVP